ncbi:MAG: hypothetical protein AAGF92_10250 [Myxococcota bacterium]
MSRSRFPIVLLVVFLGGLAMGQGEPDCRVDGLTRHVLRTSEGEYFFSDEQSEGSAIEGSPKAFEAKPGHRIEIYARDINLEREVEDQDYGGPPIFPGERSDSDAGYPGVENEWASFPAADTVKSTVPISADWREFPEGTTAFALHYDEGRCSITVPWRAADIDTGSALLDQALSGAVGGGLAEVILEGAAAGMEGASGTHVSQNVAWFADGLASFRPVPDEHPYQLHVLPKTDSKGAVDSRFALIIAYRANTQLDWSPDTAAQKVFVVFGGFVALGIADLFGIGECKEFKTGRITIEGYFDVVTPSEAATPVGTIDLDGEFVLGDPPDSVLAEAGDIAVRLTDVHVRQQGWGWPNVVCNNNKHKIERGIEELVWTTAAASIGQLTGAFSSLTPFSFERCHISAEGLTCVIAENAGDPDFVAADALGLCGHDRAPKQGVLLRQGFQL